MRWARVMADRAGLIRQETGAASVQPAPDLVGMTIVSSPAATRRSGGQIVAGSAATTGLADDVGEVYVIPPTSLMGEWADEGNVLATSDWPVSRPTIRVQPRGFPTLRSVVLSAFLPFGHLEGLVFRSPRESGHYILYVGGEAEQLDADEAVVVAGWPRRRTHRFPAGRVLRRLPARLPFIPSSGLVDGE